jgi:hemerythrin-like domain-containing protein
MDGIDGPGRRAFLTGVGGLLLAGSMAPAHQGVLLAAQPPAKPDKEKDEEDEKDKSQPGSAEEEVTPGEDLMQEHGLLKRILLVYREGIRRLERNEDLPPDAIADGARLIRDFVEDYHEKLEEEFLFPRFRKANQQVELVDTLLRQHQAGRALTDRTMRLATLEAIRDAGQRQELIGSLASFIRMYEPHEAREDTVLFPAFRKIASAHEYDALGEDFEKREHEKFGRDGFEGNVEKVAAIEKRLGIFELGQFTPKE